MLSRVTFEVTQKVGRKLLNTKDIIYIYIIQLNNLCSVSELPYNMSK